MKVTVVFLALSGCVVGPALANKTFMFDNQHGSTVWIGTLGNGGMDNPRNGGFALEAGRQVNVTTGDDWSGRFWARTGCTFDDSGNGPCDTGDCGNVLQCNGAGATPPVTLAEFDLDGNAEGDFYYVNLVDGYNVGIQIAPQNMEGYSYTCGVAGCLNGPNASCPAQLQQTDSTGALVGCNSSCATFDTDQYCCRGEYASEEACNTMAWPVNSADYFRRSCPNAFSYSFDQESRTYSCTDTSYVITVG